MSSAKIPHKKTAASPKPAKPGKDTIYIDVDDEITAIIDKVENAKQKIVALVLPKRTAVLQSIVNMRLLKRSAESAGKNIVLITSEAALLPLAGVAGIHVAKNLQSKPEIPPSPHEAPSDIGETPTEELEGGDEELPEKLDYNKPIGELASSGDEPETIDLGNEEEDVKSAAAAAAAVKPAKKSKALKVPNFDRFRLLIIAGVAGLIALIVFIVLAFTVLPKARVIVKTESTPVSLDFDLTASASAKELDEEKGIIPAQLKTSDQTSNQQVQATGQKNLGEKAKGKIKLSIPCGAVSGDPPKIPAGTGVSSGGLTFITQKTAELDNPEFGGGCKFTDTTEAAAQSSGAKYNLPSGSAFTVSGFSNVTGTSTEAMSGGTDNNVTILTQSDVDGAKSKITTQDSDNFIKTFQKQLEDTGFYVFGSTMKVGEPVVNSSPAVGQEASSASVTVKITYTVLVVQKSDMEKAVKTALNKQIDTKKERLSDGDDVLKDLTVSVQNQGTTADARLNISKETSTLPLIYEDMVKDQAKGKKESQIKSALQTYSGVKDVEVKLSPFWVSSVPKNTSKITVEIQGVKTESN